MALETVLLAMLGVVAVWLVVDACHERHRLRARMDRAEQRMRRSGTVATDHRAPANTGGVGPDSWRYWPLALPATDESRRG